MTTGRDSSSHASAWLPVFAWAGFIFVMSTDEMSAAHTLGIVEAIVRLLSPGASPEAVDMVHSAVRKLAHVSEYLLFALLIERALRLDPPAEGLHAGLVAFLAAAAYSASDEFHQSFVASRTASLVDCGIDTIGAALGALLAGTRVRRWLVPRDPG